MLQLPTAFRSLALVGAAMVLGASAPGCRPEPPPNPGPVTPPEPVTDAGVVADEPTLEPDVVIVPDEECVVELADDEAPVECAIALSPEQWCDTVFGPEGDRDAADANFVAIAQCGQCDASYFHQPDGVFCFGEEPGPDPVPPIPPPTSTCYACHAPTGYDGQHAVEDPHPWVDITCVNCHGGTSTASNPVYAHVCAPPEVGNRQQQVFDFRAFFLRFSTAGVQYLDNYECLQQNGEYVETSATDWLAFINPGDTRAGAEGKGCAACHADINTNVLRSVMGQATGLNAGSRHGAGTTKVFAERGNLDAEYGAITITNPAASGAVGEVPSLSRAPVVTGSSFWQNQAYNADQVDNSYNLVDTNAEDFPNGLNNQIAEELFQEVLNQACTGCHLQTAYNNNRAGDYRSTGCSACHYQTGVLARTNSQDPNLNRYEPIDPNNLTPGELTHNTDHRVRNRARVPTPELPVAVLGIGDTNCIVCHEGSNRTVHQFHGRRLDQGTHLLGNDDFNQVDQLGDLVNNAFFPSNNTVLFTNATELYGENQTFNNRFLTQWIKTEIWQADVTNLLGGVGQDETPEDVHHEAGMGCIDCHGTGATHGRGKILSRMKIATHENDVLCETCHGTIDDYAQNNGTQILDQGDQPLTHTIVNNAVTGEFWLASKLNGSLHYIPQVKDVVNANNAGGGGKQYPAASPRAGQPVFNLVASYAMGRYQSSGGNLEDGFGPVQGNNANIQMQDNFSHGDGYAFAQRQDGENGQGLECYTCHSAWQNNCVGCHLEPFYDDTPNNYFFSQVTGERIYFNVNAFFVYQNPIDFMMGINDRGKISPFQGLHRWMNYTDLNADTSNRYSYSDRHGLGNDPALRNPNRNTLPALQNQPFTPHSIRGRYTQSAVGMRGCLDCHVGNADSLLLTDQVGDEYALHDFIANEEDYANAIVYNVNMAYGRENTGLYQFDANGEPVNITNNAPAFDVMRIVEDDGTTNSSSNHGLLDPFNINGEYLQLQDTNTARVTRPLTGTVLSRLQTLNNIDGGLGNVYYYNGNPGVDPTDVDNGGQAPYFLNDYAYITQ